MAFVTVDEVATRLGWPLTSDEQARVQAFIDDCTVLIEDYCGIDFTQHIGETFDLPATCSTKLSIPRRYRHNLVVESVAFEDGTALTDWELHDHFLWRDCGWSDGQTVSVTGSWGYSTPPAILTVVCAAEVMRWVAQTPGLDWERTGEREVHFAVSSSPQTLSEYAKHALRRLRPSVGVMSLTREGCA